MTGISEILDHETPFRIDVTKETCVGGRLFMKYAQVWVYIVTYYKNNL